jgi:hypothetical protein
MYRYIISLSLLTLLLGGLITILAGIFPNALASHYVLPISIYFFLVTLGFHFGLVRSSKGNPSVFIRYYMAATTLKLFLHLGVLVIVAVLKSGGIIPFVITFVVHYAVYTAFEVVFAYRFSRTAK